jgi:hypothetical protein
MRRATKLTAVALAALLMAACPKSQDSAGTPLTDEQKAERVMLGVADGFNVAALSIEQGVPVVRQFRQAGKIKREDSLKAARLGKRITEVMLKVSDYFARIDAVSESERRDLLSDINDIIKLADDIKSISWSDGGQQSNAQLAFGLSVLAAGSALQIAAQSFKDKLPSGFTVNIPSTVKQRFAQARPALARDVEILNRSIEELSR